MTIDDIKRILEAKELTENNDLTKEVDSACGSDMMSDVLAYVKNHSVLLTGLVNPQIVRTAEMMDMLCIVLVRGKRVSDDVIMLAEDRDIVILSTEYRMYTACGLLYESGLKSEGADKV